MLKHFARTLFFIPVALLMPAANAGAAQNGYPGQKCNADEIHWTITGPTSVTFDWRGAADKIRYGATIGYGHTGTGEIPKPLPFSSAGPFCQVPLTALKPNALYHYSIGTCPDHTFRTPPPPGRANFIIDAEGDIGSSRDYKDVLPDQELIAAHVPAAVLVLGDLSYANPNGQASVDQHFNDMMVWSQDVPYMPAWGNHEWDVPRNDDLRNYKGLWFAQPADISGSSEFRMLRPGLVVVRLRQCALHRIPGAVHVGNVGRLVYEDESADG